MKYFCKEDFKINDVLVGIKGDTIEIKNSTPEDGESPYDVEGYCDITNISTGKKYTATRIDIDNPSIIIKHEAEVYISASEFNRINSLLAIISLEEMTTEALMAFGATTDYCEGIFSVEFDNGSRINFDLCSGQHNYWDDVVWTSSDGTRDVVLDCEYALGDIEVEIESELYIVKVIKKL